MRISSASFLSSMTLASLLYFMWFPVGWEIRLPGFHLDHTLAVWLRATDLNSLCTITCLQNGDNRCYLHLGLLNVLNEIVHGKHLAKYQTVSPQQMLIIIQVATIQAVLEEHRRQSDRCSVYLFIVYSIALPLWNHSFLNLCGSSPASE